MSQNVGSIAYIASIDTSKLRSDAKEAEGIAKNTGDGIEKGVTPGTSRASAVLAKFGKVAKVAAIAAGTTLAVGLAAAAKASFSQVSAVEQATVGLKAYEKNGGKVNDVLKGLIGYARSDLGVLFNRKDLFQSAQSLKIMGDKTEDLVGHTKILSRSVGLGLSTFENLNQVVGRVGSTGRLTGIDFDNLTKAGFKLDDKFRNTDITFEKLFKQLDKGIPADALNGQANTIKGNFIRLESAFRSVGDAVLGVDSDTSKFIKGGLGASFVSGVGKATDLLKDMKKPVAAVAIEFGNMAKKAVAVAGDVLRHLSPSLKALAAAVGGPLLQGLKDVASSDFAKFLGTTAVIALKLTIDVVGRLVNILGGFLSVASRATPILAGLVSGFLIYKATIVALNVVTAIQNALLVTQGTSFAVLKAALFAAKTSLVGTTVAQTGLNVAMALNPVGLLAAAVGGLAVALGVAAYKISQNKTAQERLNDARRQAKVATDAAKAAEDKYRGALVGQKGAALGAERAQRTYNEAVKQFGPKSLEAREANYALGRSIDATKKADKEAKDAQQERDRSQAESNKKAGAVKAAEQRKKDAIQATKDEINRQRNALSDLSTTLHSLDGKRFNYTVNGTSTGNAKGKAAAGLASGGPAQAGKPYFVGENRDGSLNKTSELFVPRSSGRIINSKDLQGMLSGNGGGGSASYNIQNINISKEVDGDRWIRKLTGRQEIVSSNLVPTQGYGDN